MIQISESVLIEDLQNARPLISLEKISTPPTHPPFRPCLSLSRIQVGNFDAGDDDDGAPVDTNVDTLD